MSKTASAERETDHREEVAFVAISAAHGSERRLHKVAGEPEPGEYQNGEECEVACRTSLSKKRSKWQAKPAAVFPPGHYPLCTNPGCFGEEEA